MRAHSSESHRKCPIKHKGGSSDWLCNKLREIFRHLPFFGGILAYLIYLQTPLRIGDHRLELFFAAQPVCSDHELTRHAGLLFFGVNNKNAIGILNPDYARRAPRKQHHSNLPHQT
jgi:hypothetical protein